MVQHEQRLREALVTSGQPTFGYGVSPGIRDLAWPVPVYVGDVITYTVEYLEKRPLRSRPGWGLLLHQDEGVNQRGETVLRMTANLFVRAPGRLTPALDFIGVNVDLNLLANDPAGVVSNEGGD